MSERRPHSPPVAGQVDHVEAEVRELLSDVALDVRVLAPAKLGHVEGLQPVQGQPATVPGQQASHLLHKHTGRLQHWHQLAIL